MYYIYQDLSEFLNKELGSTFEVRRELKVKDLQDERMKIKSPIFLEINFILEEKGVLAAFKIKTKPELVCDRCLKNFEKEFSLDFEQEYQFHPQQEKEEEILPILLDKKVEIFKPVWEEILSSLPYKVLCDKGCRGIGY